MDAQGHAAGTGGAATPPVSAHFVNNVLAAAASYIEDDPDYARDVLAELGQFLSYRLRADTVAVSAAQELAHTTSYLRLQQARFPDRITVRLPDAAELPARRLAPGAVQEPVAVAVGRRLREHRGPCVVDVRVAGEAELTLSVSGADGEGRELVEIELKNPEEAMA